MVREKADYSAALMVAWRVHLSVVKMDTRSAACWARWSAVELAAESADWKVDWTAGRTAEEMADSRDPQTADTKDTWKVD